MKSKVMIMSLAILASTTVSCFALTVPHDGTVKTKYSQVTGGDNRFKLQASEAKYTSNSRKGLTMFYLNDKTSGDTASGYVDLAQRDKGIFLNRGIQAMTHTHTATDHEQ